jgi:hypothetical protein
MPKIPKRLLVQHRLLTYHSLFDDEMYRLNIPQMDIMSDFVERVEELFSTMNGVWVWLHALTTNHRITSTWPTVDKLRQFDQLRTSSRGKVNPHLLFSTIHTASRASPARTIYHKILRRSIAVVNCMLKT